MNDISLGIGWPESGRGTHAYHEPSSAGLAEGSLRRFIAVLAVVLFVVAMPGAWAKAYYANELETIERAEVIAIVNISRVEKATTESKPFDYGEIAHATVERTIKGTLPETVKLYGGESFICAQVHYGMGRQLVFLRRNEGLLVGCNWGMSVRPIKDGKVEWFLPRERFKVSWQELEAVLTRVKNPPADASDR